MTDTMEHANGRAPVVAAHKLDDATPALVEVRAGTAFLAQSVAGFVGADSLDKVIATALDLYRQQLLAPPPVEVYERPKGRGGRRAAA